MKIKLESTVADVKKAFTKLYPGLKIEFYSKPHEDHQGSHAKHLLPDDKVLKSLMSIKADGEINPDPDLTVGDLERAFADQFGLYVQIYRKSKDLWLQTSSTDDWTLEKQNRKGIHSTQL
ncbi:MAG: hypothetical protein HKN76_18805 [Saprospiraceae bacterium]|nr:hypothetical protein [Saprospiraceae bacterium]